ncbi:type VII toxin-antitoxin system HepT family RNase toxin [Salinicola peritrichatus]|uniref:type VII toxin-antitoxin system HepT family RNase toxin n=1 Tax=Salinicola peritrichatus TaxID=1267424 RepID=UPI000DA184C1|nr:DUF86 domain-containing protein [Salinicola peritrichatus]
MESEYIDAMREHLAILEEELGQLHEAASRPGGLNGLLYRAAERNLQLLTEACIGIAKQRLKSLGTVVPSDARQAFAKLHNLGHDLSETPWNKVIGLRNALVHDYLKLDTAIVETIIRQRDYQRLIDFAREQLSASSSQGAR